MFHINRRIDYAIRALICLAKRPAGARLPAAMIREEMLIPRAFLQRIIADLSRAELVRTYPGPGGGLELARAAGRINLRHIWEAVEGPLFVSDCIESPGACRLENSCPVHFRWQKLQAVLACELESSTLDQLAAEAEQLSSLELPVMDAWAVQSEAKRCLAVPDYRHR